MVPEAWDLHLEMALIFLKGIARADVPARGRMDGLVFWGGELVRLKLPRKVRQLLHERPHERLPGQLGTPVVQKRLYVPQGLVGKPSVRTAIEDLVALLCLYLGQEELVVLEEDQSVREFLFAYVRRFKGATELGVSYAVGQVVTHYQSPEDFRALRQYVAKTIYGLTANQKRREGPDPLLKRAITQELGSAGPKRTSRQTYHTRAMGRVTMPGVSDARRESPGRERSLRNA